MEYSLIYKLPVWIVIAVLLLFCYESKSCIEREKSALLQIKKYFTSFLSDKAPPILPSWKSHPKENCCVWERVTCDPSSGHIIELSLGSLRSSDFESEMEYLDDYCWSITRPPILNMTIFQDFAKLHTLDLSQNCITSFVKEEEEGMCKIRNLRALNLTGNQIHGIIPTCVGSLSFLTRLDLSDNHFTGSIPSAMCKMVKLQVLDLSFNEFNGSIPKCIGSLSCLTELDLSRNSFNGTISPAMCKLVKLQVLKLRENELEGRIPKCIGSLSCLTELDLSENSFNGTILPDVSNLKSLKMLDISSNLFQDKFLLSVLSDHANLSCLVLSDNMFEIETEDSNWIPSFQLNQLFLRNCSLNKESKTFPTFITHQYLLETLILSDNGLVGSFPHNISCPYLQFLDLSGNMLSGELPQDIGVWLPSLNRLDLSTNNFEGPIPSSLVELKGLSLLDLSNNNFSSEVPTQFHSNSLYYLSLSMNNLNGKIIPKIMNLTLLAVLTLDNNKFSGSIGESLMRLPNLNELDISNNKISGEIPSWMGAFPLVSLSLGGNHLQGQIPSAICNLTQLRYLDLSKSGFTGLPQCIGTLSVLEYLGLSNNNFGGEIPDELSNSSNLFGLDMRHNQLIGGIPSWINRLSKLELLQLGNNMLNGHIPLQLCSLQYLNILDVSSNEFSGIIPSCFNNLSLGSTNSDLRFYGKISFELVTKGVLELYIGSITNEMSGLDMSCNRLTGHIPSELGELARLYSLNLSHNNLIGFIPKSFSNLTAIESLDLSFNNLSGKIPSDLADLHFLADFNVSYNNLSGRVPQTAQFANFDLKSYLGNPFLYGFVQGRNHSTTPREEETRDKDEENSFDWRVFFCSFSASFGVFFIIVFWVFYINPQLYTSLFVLIEIHMLRWFR